MSTRRPRAPLPTGQASSSSHTIGWPRVHLAPQGGSSSIERARTCQHPAAAASRDRDGLWHPCGADGRRDEVAAASGEDSKIAHSTLELVICEGLRRVGEGGIPDLFVFPLNLALEPTGSV